MNNYVREQIRHQCLSLMHSMTGGHRGDVTSIMSPEDSAYLIRRTFPRAVSLVGANNPTYLERNYKLCFPLLLEGMGGNVQARDAYARARICRPEDLPRWMKCDLEQNAIAFLGRNNTHLVELSGNRKGIIRRIRKPDLKVELVGFSMLNTHTYGREILDALEKVPEVPLVVDTSCRFRSKNHGIFTIGNPTALGTLARQFAREALPDLLKCRIIQDYTRSHDQKLTEDESKQQFMLTKDPWDLPENSHFNKTLRKTGNLPSVNLADRFIDVSTEYHSATMGAESKAETSEESGQGNIYREGILAALEVRRAKGDPGVARKLASYVRKGRISYSKLLEALQQSDPARVLKELDEERISEKVKDLGHDLTPPISVSSPSKVTACQPVRTVIVIQTEPFASWLKVHPEKDQIERRLERLVNEPEYLAALAKCREWADLKPLGNRNFDKSDGMFEIKFSWPGAPRVYGLLDNSEPYVVTLLVGGNKRSQQDDIAIAHRRLRELKVDRGKA